jgi:hypothetical protein
LTLRFLGRDRELEIYWEKSCSEGTLLAGTAISLLAKDLDLGEALARDGAMGARETHGH